MSKTIIYKCKCENCGAEFETDSTLRKYCSKACALEVTKKRERERNKKIKEEKRREEEKKAHKWDILGEIERYNKKHKTSLSYGQYLAMKQVQEQEKIRKRKERGKNGNAKKDN